jgi:hypothetical protein
MSLEFFCFWSSSDFGVLRSASIRKGMKRWKIKNVRVISAYALQVITMIYFNLYEMLFWHQYDINLTSTIRISLKCYKYDTHTKLKYAPTITKNSILKCFLIYLLKEK